MTLWWNMLELIETSEYHNAKVRCCQLSVLWKGKSACTGKPEQCLIIWTLHPRFQSFCLKWFCKWRGWSACVTYKLQKHRDV